MTIAVFFNPNGEPDGFLRLMDDFPGLDMRAAPDAAALAGALEGAEILITSNRVYTPDNARLIRERGTSLRWIQFVTSGFDKAQASGLPRGVAITNVAGLRAFAVAEHALFLLLGLMRRVRLTERARAQGTWSRDEVTPLLDNLAGKRLLIVGCGAIGQEIARKAKAFDMHVTGLTRASGPLAHFDALRPRAQLVEAAAACDALVVAAAYDETTSRIISRAVIDALPRHAVVANIARGLLIDQDALVEALAAGRIAGVGLDVMEEEPMAPDHPLWSMDGALITPHIAGAGGPGTGATHASMFADNLRRYLAGEKLANLCIERT
jgi:phosphoglycerate dehydrogenase-like enzyme